MSRDISERWPDADAAAEIGGPVTEPEIDGERVLADGSGGYTDFRARPVAVIRDSERVAAGALLPSGTVAVEWNREAFPEGERTDEPTTSLYGHVEDAEEATGGTLIVNPDADDSPILLAEVESAENGGEE
ncbi:hypothetical protein [Haloarcula sp. CBA1129]|uniref:hypothetical protein n=1 Tax=Haloarcula sp. CBA1129 TaxID=1853684 RepID=UPI001248A76F|nr:hypothetical protein [Haloarcula sp. CBA1129]KAA9399689.1 hypothetical protein Har1129_16270 [Haloarcula sp. CBA1129]